MSSITPDYSNNSVNFNYITNPITTALNINNNNITNVNNLQVSTINGSTYALPISNRTLSTTVSTIGTGFSTLLQNTILTTASFDIDIWATINYSYTHTSGGVNAVVRVLFDGSPVGNNQTISLDNNNLNGQVSIIAGFINASVGSHTITLQMQKSASGGTLQHLNSTMLVIGNIV